MQRATYPVIVSCSLTCFKRQLILFDLLWPQGGSVEPHCPPSMSPICGWQTAFRHSKQNELESLYVWSSLWGLWSEIFDLCQGLSQPLGPHYLLLDPLLWSTWNKHLLSIFRFRDYYPSNQIKNPKPHHTNAYFLALLILISLFGW